MPGQATWIHSQEPNELVAVKTVPFVPDNIDLESELSIMNRVKCQKVDNLVHVKAIYFFEDHSLPSPQSSAPKQSLMGIVMRWFEDGSLRDRLVRTQSHKRSCDHLGWKDKLQLALDVCNGLGKLHEMALLHRDVKSDNVLLKMENGRLKGECCDDAFMPVTASNVATHARLRLSVRLRHLRLQRECKCSQTERVRDAREALWATVSPPHSPHFSFGTLIFCAPELFVKDEGPSK